MGERPWTTVDVQSAGLDSSVFLSTTQHRPSDAPNHSNGTGNLPGQPTPGSSRSASLELDPASTSSAGPSSKVARGTRVRVSKACTPCRKVKLKCDGETPCGRCLGLKLPVDECIFPPSLRGKTRRKRVEIEADRRALDGELVPEERASGKRSRVGEVIQRGELRDTRQWDGGWTMRSMKEDFAKWKHDENLSMNGPRNENMWNHGLDSNRGQNGSSSTGHRRMSPPILSYEHEVLSDRYTSLPYLGEGHDSLGVLAEASAAAGSAAVSPSPFQPTGGPGARPDAESEEEVERSRGYNVPLEKVLKKDAPHIMSLISISEAEELFEAYFRLLHPHLPFLDREHSTPAALAQRNNFLFNAICCVAARASHPVLWGRLKEFARFEMDRFPKDKNIDVVQGHLIYSVWNITGPRTFEQDKSWLRVGIAIRTGLDINLHRVALSKSARKGLPDWLLRMIIRTWLLTYVIDRTLSAQLGKPTTLRNEHSFHLYSDLISEDLGKKTVDDAWVSYLAEWTHIVGRVHDLLGGDSSDLLNPRSAFFQSLDLVHVFTKQLHQLRESSVVNARTLEHIDNELGSRRMISNISLYHRYARLIVHSFGLQQASESRKANLPSAFAEYQISAIRLIEEFESDLESAGLTLGCPDFIFTFLSFAAVSLLKCVRPQYAKLEPDQPSLIALARKAASILSRSATTPDHLTAMQYSCLTKLIKIRSEPTTSINAFGTIDFEAFGQSVDADLSKTPWPPSGPSITRPQSPSVSTNQNTASGLLHSGIQDDKALAGVDMNMLEPDFGWGMGMGTNMGLDEQGSADGFGWLSGLGLGEGFLGTDIGNGNGNNGDLGFAQDPFWKSILENAPTSH